MGYVVVLAVVTGLCGWMPRRILPGPASDRPESWPGLTFFLAIVAIPALLYILNPLMGIGLRASAWTVVVLAVLGAARWVVRLRRDGPGWAPSALFHPLVVFGLALAVVLLLRGGLVNVPIDGLELSVWTYDARLRFAADTWMTPAMDLNLVGYTIGWSLLMDFPNLLLDKWTGGEAALPFLLHLGLLATTYDLVPRLVDPEGRLGSSLRVLLGWAVILLLLAAQAYWILFAVKQTIEPVQVYATAMTLTVALAGTLRGIDRLRLAAVIGMLFAAGYLFKAAGLTLGLSLGVLWAAYLGFDWAEAAAKRPLASWAWRGLVMAVAFLAPAFFFFLSWRIIAHPTGCFASAVDFARTVGGALAEGDTIGRVTPRVLDKAGAYLAAYKMPLTAFSAAVLLVSLGVARLRWVAVAFFVYAAVYLSAQYASYLGCVGVNEGLERYMRVVLRPMHGLGLVLAAVLTARWGIGRLAGGARPLRLPLPWLAAMALVPVALGIWQIQRLAADVAEVAERTDPTSAPRMARLKVIETQARELIRQIEARGLKEPRVILVKQGEAEFEWDAARLLSVNVSGSGPLYHYRLGFGWTWRPAPDPTKVTATRVARQGDIPATFLRNDVIWLLGLDDWLRQALTPLVDSPACLAHPAGFFLFRNAAGTGFDCVAKKGPA